MDLKEKKQKLAEIKEEFEYGMFQNGKVENIGTIFFLYYTGCLRFERRRLLSLSPLRHSI